MGSSARGRYTMPKRNPKWDDFRLECPKCGLKETDDKNFIDTEVYCEDCGSHPAIRCPKCGDTHSRVWEDLVCAECGLILAYSKSLKCSRHPKARAIGWWSTLHRGRVDT